MSKPELPDRIKATLTIDLDFAKEDMPQVGEVLHQIVDSLSISGQGNGSRTAKSHYSYKLESNLPKVPMTMERLFDMFDEAREPGEPSARELIADSMHPGHDEAVEWWEGLASEQREWFLQKYPDVRLPTHARERHQGMSDADRREFDGLSAQS